MQSINTELFLYLNDLGRLVPEAVWVHLTNLGDTAVALCILVMFYRFKLDSGFRLLLIALLGTLVIQGLKHLFDLDRPPVALDISSFHLIGSSISSPSMPSGHTATAFIVAGLLSAQYTKCWIYILSIALAAFVGLSRIMIGVHWPADVMLGAILGWLIGFYGWKYLLRLKLSACWINKLGLVTIAVVLVNQIVYSLPYRDFALVSASQWLFTGFAVVGMVRALRAYFKQVITSSES